MRALRREIETRLKPDVLALQECPGRDPCDAVPAGFVLVGVAGTHAQGRFAHLYCREGLRMEKICPSSGAPVVIGRMQVNDLKVDVVLSLIHISEPTRPY